MNEKDLSYYGATKAQNILLKRHNKDLLKENIELKEKIKYHEIQITKLCQEISNIDNDTNKIKKEENPLNITKEDVKELKKQHFVSNLIRQISLISKNNSKLRKKYHKIANEYIDLLNKNQKNKEDIIT